MVHPLSDDVKAEKNQLASDGTWHILYDVEISSGVQALYLVANSEPVTFEGRTYQPFPVSFGELEETSTGDLPSLQLTVSNVSREIEAFLEHRDGMRGEEVRMHFVHSDHLDDALGVITRSFRIRGVAADSRAVTFTLSNHPFLQLKWPYRKYVRNRCHHRYKSGGCPFANPSLPGGVADIPNCDKTLNGSNGCLVHKAAYDAAGEDSSLFPKRIGAFPTIPKRRVS